MFGEQPEVKPETKEDYDLTAAKMSVSNSDTLDVSDNMNTSSSKITDIGMEESDKDHESGSILPTNELRDTNTKSRGGKLLIYLLHFVIFKASWL